MNTREQLDRIAASRVLILDGAMGSLIQAQGLSEEDFKGDRFATHNKPLKGCNDLLSITKPEVIVDIHRAYLLAGADLIETNTFNASAISLSDYGLAELCYELNLHSGRLAKQACAEFSTAQKPRFAVGILGPTSKTASISPDVNDPGYRAITFEQLKVDYGNAARGLMDGGVDILMVETVFDTLNAKAAVYAILELFEERGAELPLMISGTISDASGRTLSGQTLESFWASLAHAKPWSIGLNCALGAEQLIGHIEELSQLANCWVSSHPNAGLPNQFGLYDQTPMQMAKLLRPFMTEGLVNILGGCCGTTPEHIAALAREAEDVQGIQAWKPRQASKKSVVTRYAGLETLRLDSVTGFVNIGERTNVAGSRKFLKLIQEGNYAKALDIARDMAENGAQMIDVCMDDGMLDALSSMRSFLLLAQSDPDIARLPFVLDSSQWPVLEAGLRCVQGKCLVNSLSLKEGPEAFLQKAKLLRRYGAGVIVMLFDERGQADSYERKIEIAQRSYDLLTSKAGFRRKISFLILISWLLVQAWKNTPITLLLTSKPAAGLKPLCPEFTSPEVSPIYPSPLGATTLSARLSIQYFYITLLLPDWICPL
jgi:5-methyltetrahydrofolate--homocysteine methyltransferase